MRVYFSSCSVGPRPSERPSDKKRRRSDITENIVEEARRSITALQPAEARMDYWNRLSAFRSKAALKSAAGIIGQ
jgi:hypothetical protein